MKRFAATSANDGYSTHVAYVVADDRADIIGRHTDRAHKGAALSLISSRSLGLVSRLAMTLMALGSTALLGASSAHAAPESLLWNPGPKYKASVTYTKTFSPASDWGCVASGTTLVEAHLVGNPPGAFTDPSLLKCENDTFVPLASNGAAPSYSPGAAVGWTSADEDEVPGWAIQTLSGGGGTPMVMKYVNRGENTNDDCKLREVGMGYQHWPNLDVSNFKPNPGGGALRVGEFETILGKVSLRETYAGGQSTCEELPTGALNIGFRVDYVRPDGSSERGDAIATIVRGLPGNIDFNGIEDDIYYRNHDGSAVVVYGESLGLPEVSSSWQDYTVDFKELLEEYVPPPPGYSVHDAVISGFDVFTSLRGADMDFEAKGLDLVGVRRAVDSDVDGDRQADLVSLRPNGIVRVHPGGADLKFGAGTTSFAGNPLDPAQYDGQGSYVIDVSDVDGDKHSDLVTLTDDGDVHVFAGTSAATFDEVGVTSELNLSPGLLQAGGDEPVAVADINGDRHADLIVYDDDAHTIKVYPGDESGSFGAAVLARSKLTSALHRRVGHYFVDAADVTGDGRADLTSLHGGDLNVFEGKSDGTFSAATISHAGDIDIAMDDGEGYEPLGLGDVTGDGRADLALVNAGTVSLYPGRSSAEFGVPSSSFAGNADSTTFGANGFELLGILDVDGDGRADIGGVSNGDDILRVIKGQASGAFGPGVLSSGTFPSTQHSENQNSTGNEFVSEKPSWRRRGCGGQGCGSIVLPPSDDLLAAGVYGANLNLYARGSDGNLHQLWCCSAPNGWSESWYSLGAPGGGPNSFGPAALSHYSNFNVYVRGADGKLHQRWCCSGPSGWSESWYGLGAPNDDELTSGPAAAGINGEVHILARGSDGDVHERWCCSGPNGWSESWISLDAPNGQPVTSAPAVTPHYSNLNAYVRGNDGNLYQNWRGAGGWSESWYGLGAPGDDELTSGPAAATIDNEVHVFARGPDGEVHERWCCSGGSGWSESWLPLDAPNGEPITSAPVAATYNGKLYVIVQDAYGDLYEKHRPSGDDWSSWNLIGAAP